MDQNIIIHEVPTGADIESNVKVDLTLEMANALTQALAKEAGLSNLRVAREVTLGHESAEALAQHDRLADAQRIAQPHHVIGKGVERPLVGRPPVAAAVAAVIDVDNLRHVGKLREQRLEA